MLVLTHCSSWELLHQELERIKSILINNPYDLPDIEKVIRQQLDKFFKKEGHTGDIIKLFYQNSMSKPYAKEEKILRDIIEKNCVAREPEDKLQLVVYYKSPRVSSLLMKNNLAEDSSPLKATNVVYKYKCTSGDCARRPDAHYVGFTTTTLSRRISYHLTEGAPEKHHRLSHNEDITRKMMVDNTTILTRCLQKKKLKVMEAAFIREMQPSINIQMKMNSYMTLYDSAPLGPRA